MAAAEIAGGGGATHPPSLSTLTHDNKPIRGLEIIENGDYAPSPVTQSIVTSPILEIIEEDNSAATLPEQIITASIEATDTTGSESITKLVAYEDDDPISKSDVETMTLEPPTPLSIVTTHDSAADPDKKALVLDMKEDLKNLMDDGGKIIHQGGGGVQGLDSSILLSPQMLDGDRRMGESLYPSAADEESLINIWRGGAPEGERYTVLEATIVDDVVYDAVPFSDHVDKSSPGLRKRQIYCALTSLVIVAAIATGVSVAVVKSNSNQESETPTILERLAPDGLLADWVKCTDSQECSNGCCSSTFSQGIFTCTLLDTGYLPGTCIGQGTRQEESRGDWVDCNSSLQCTNGCCSNAFSEGFWKCTPLVGGYLGDPDICISHAEESKGWEECTASDDCSTGCCSSTYSEGVLKCTPLVGGYRNDTCVGKSVKEEESIGDWVECSSSLQCANGCCSNAFSEGFWKCTPLIGGYLGDPEICMSHAEESIGWEECTTSDDCSTGCCSSTYSEGVLKCTPLYGGYRNDTCVGVEGN